MPNQTKEGKTIERGEDDNKKALKMKQKMEPIVIKEGKE